MAAGDKWYLDARATGANNGDVNGTVDANGIMQDAWQSFEDYDASGETVNTTGETMNLIEGSGPYFIPTSNSGASVFDGKWTGPGSGDPLNWNCNKNIISAMIDANDGTYKWTASVTDGEWYLELASGGDPSLAEVKCCVIDGNMIISSADDNIYNRQRGTVGSLGAGVPSGTENYSAGWGNNGAGFNTLHIKSAVNPTTRHIWFAAATHALTILFDYHTFNDAVLIGGNDGLFKATRLEVTLNRCMLCFSDFDGATYDHTAGGLTLNNCLTYWTGHRGLRLSKAGGAVTANNHTDWGAHLGVLVDSGLASGDINLYNVIIANNEAGAIHNASAAVNINGSHRHLYPRMTAFGGALGYVDPANWTPTDVTDNPSNVATTLSDQGLLEDPEFENPDDYAFYTMKDNLDGLYDYLVAGFTLKSTSPIIGKGLSGVQQMGTQAMGEPIPGFDVDQGCVQSQHGPFHPTKL